MSSSLSLSLSLSHAHSLTLSLFLCLSLSLSLSLRWLCVTWLLLQSLKMKSQMQLVRSNILYSCSISYTPALVYSVFFCSPLVCSALSDLSWHSVSLIFMLPPSILISHLLSLLTLPPLLPSLPSLPPHSTSASLPPYPPSPVSLLTLPLPPSLTLSPSLVHPLPD